MLLSRSLRPFAAPILRRLRRPRPGQLALHIGDPGAGAACLQAGFAAGVRIDGHRVFYPDGIDHNGLATPQKAGALARRLAASSARYRLLSAETLAGMAPQAVARLLAQIPPGATPLAARSRLVRYIQPHAARLVSAYIEAVTLGRFAGTLEAYVAEEASGAQLRYLPQLSAWQAEFGAAFHLRPFLPAELKNGSIIEDFTETAFGKSPDGEAAQAAVPPELCLEDLMRLQVLQARQKDRPKPLRQALGRAFCQQIARLPPPPSRTPLRLPRPLAEMVHDRCHADAAALDAQFFAGRPLMRAALEQAIDTAPITAAATDPRDHFDATELRSLTLLSDMIASLLDTPEGNWPRHLRQSQPQQGGKATGTRAAQGKRAEGKPGKQRQQPPGRRPRKTDSDGSD